MRLRFCWLIPAVLLSLSCEHADPLQPDGGGLEPTLSSIQANIFNQKCATSSCHVGSSAPHGLDLSEGAAHGNLVGVRSREVPALFRVSPGDPDDSYLVMKLRGDPRIVGQQMPLTGEKLSGEEIDVVAEWIAQGAADD